jgi:hypothetical protein
MAPLTGLAGLLARDTRPDGELMGTNSCMKPISTSPPSVTPTDPSFGPRVSGFARTLDPPYQKEIPPCRVRFAGGRSQGVVNRPPAAPLEPENTMFRLLAALFASDDAPRSRTPDNTFRPELTAAEDRTTPAVIALNPGVLVGFDPQPEPPLVAKGFNPQPDPPLTKISLSAGK